MFRKCGFSSTTTRLNSATQPAAPAQSTSRPNKETTPTTGKSCTTDATGKPIVTRQQFPGNVIPQNRLDPVAVNFISHYPVPNSPGTITGAANFNALSHSANNFNDTQFYRLDHQFSDKNHFNVMWANDYMLQTPCGGYCGQPQSAVADYTATRYWIAGVVFLAGLDTVLTPTLINDFRFGLVRNTF